MVFLGVLVLVVWAHVCAQFLGLVGGRPVALAGAPVPATIRTVVPVPIPGPLTEPLVGEIAPPSLPKPPGHRMGKPVKRDIRELAGRIRIR
jgi:hypothetical protein